MALTFAGHRRKANRAGHLGPSGRVQRILIANRGEIACRIIKTARRMGWDGRGLFEADRDALHVEMADEAVLKPHASRVRSYLVIDKIVDACKRTGAKPYTPATFLSEREGLSPR